MKTTMLEYHLNVLKSAITFQIVAQDVKVDSFLKKERVFTASNGWRVMISNRPEINKDAKVIYLRGNDERRDEDVVRVTKLGSDKDTKKFANAIDLALGEMAAKAANKKDKRPITLVDNILVSASFGDFIDSNYGRTPKVFIIRS